MTVSCRSAACLFRAESRGGFRALSQRLALDDPAARGGSRVRRGAARALHGARAGAEALESGMVRFSDRHDSCAGCGRTRTSRGPVVRSRQPRWSCAYGPSCRRGRSLRSTPRRDNGAGSWDAMIARSCDVADNGGRLYLSPPSPADVDAQPRLFSLRVPAVVWFLGLTSFLTDLSSEMIVSVLPAYLVLEIGPHPLRLRRDRRALPGRQRRDAHRRGRGGGSGASVQGDRGGRLRLVGLLARALPAAAVGGHDCGGRCHRSHWQRHSDRPTRRAHQSQRPARSTGRRVRRASRARHRGRRARTAPGVCRAAPDRPRLRRGVRRQPGARGARRRARSGCLSGIRRGPGRLRTIRPGRPYEGCSGCRHSDASSSPPAPCRSRRSATDCST